MLDLSLREFASETGGTLDLGSMPPVDGDATPLGRIVTHCRQIAPGDVYWDLRNDRFGRRGGAEVAFAQGAAGVVVSGQRAAPWAGRFVLHVDDSLRALWQLASVMRYRFAGSVIAVGSNSGRCLASELVACVLARNLQGTLSPRHYNNEIGLPLSMLRWQPTDDYAVVEISDGNRGNIDALVSLAQPDVAVVGSGPERRLLPEDSPDAAVENQAQLLAGLNEDGFAVLAADGQPLGGWLGNCRANFCYVGAEHGCELRATHVDGRPGALRFRVDGTPFRLRVSGRHHLNSALMAIQVGRILGLRDRDLASALSEFEPSPRHCEVIRHGRKTIINDTFNSSSRSLEAALEVLRDFPSTGRRWVACGDVPELGPSSEAVHYGVGRRIVEIGGADGLVAYGRQALQVARGARDAGLDDETVWVVSGLDEALPTLADELSESDVALVKGSRVLRPESVIEAIQRQRLAWAA